MSLKTLKRTSSIEIAVTIAVFFVMMNSTYFVLFHRSSLSAPITSLKAQKFISVSQAKPKDFVPKILWWTTVSGKHNSFAGVGTKNAHKYCKKKCLFTEDKSQVKSSHAVVFHAWGVDMHFESKIRNGKKITVPQGLPTYRDANQYYIYYTMEAPARGKIHSESFRKFFNWTMNYRLDSDFPITYSRFVRKADEDIQAYVDYPEFTDQLANRSNLVAWMVSNCIDSTSKRRKLVNAIERYVPISKYGRCGGQGQRCKKSIKDCYIWIGKTHKFYLAFENSLCEDYVTEKFFYSYEANMVPVVYGKANYGHRFPPGSFINVDSFPSAKALTDYLLYLDGNDEEYLKYFRWRKYYREELYRPAAEMYCAVCERLYKEYGVSKSRVDIHEWLYRPNAEAPVCTEPALLD